MVVPTTVQRRFIAAGVAMFTLAALAVLFFLPSSEVAAQQNCIVDFSLPSGTYAMLAPGESATFSYTVEVTAYDMQAIGVEVITGQTSGLGVSVQPAFTNVAGIDPEVSQTYPVFGRITVTVPEAFLPGSYSVSGIAAVANCTGVVHNGDSTNYVNSSSALHLTIDVERPLPSPTPEPEPTRTPIPPPAVCEPGFSLAGRSFDAEPGERISVPFEASVAVRRVSEVVLTAVSDHEGGIAVAFEPGGQTFGFDPLPSETVFQTFSGTVHLDIPADQQPGTHGVNGLYIQASCQGVDSFGSATSFRSQSEALSITVRLASPTATPEPTSTNTAIPSPTATVTATVTATATARPSRTPTPGSTATATATARPTGTSTPTVTPDPSATPSVTPSGTPTVTQTNTAELTATPRSIVREPVLTQTPSASTPDAPVTATAGDDPAAAPVEPSSTPESDNEQMASASLTWQESRALFAEQESESGWGKPLAVILAAALIAAGSAGVWHTRFRGAA